MQNNNVQPNSYDISIILTAHAEGRLVHRTIRSALRAISVAAAEGIQVEFIAILDKPSPETVEYFQENHCHIDKVVHVDYGDPGLTRNHGAKVAQGRYLAFLDADDLFSKNWLSVAFRFAEHWSESNKRPLVLHPQINLFFGADLFFVEPVKSVGLQIESAFPPFHTIFTNPYTALAFVDRTFCLEHPYQPSELQIGFGYEDWHWNCETIAAGAVHHIVPNTMHFIRMKESGSLMQQSRQMRAVIRPSQLFDILSEEAVTVKDDESAEAAQILVGLENKRSISLKSQLYKKVRTVYRRSISRWVMVERLAQLRREMIIPLRRFATVRSKLPQWCLNEWREMHTIEPELFPTRRDISRIYQQQTSTDSAAIFYPELSTLTGSPTHIILVPCLCAGGADTEGLHYIKALCGDENIRLTCITTENLPSTRLAELPPQVKLVELGKILAGERLEDQVVLLVRLLLQKRPQVVHVINSSLGWSAVREFGAALKSQSHLFASVSTVETTDEGQQSGFALEQLPTCIANLTSVFSDNQTFIQYLLDTYAFDSTKLRTVYFPTSTPIRDSLIRDNPVQSGVLNVLWASRLVQEKCPDLLTEIAQKMRTLPIHFHVYGEMPLDAGYHRTIKALKGLTNVTLYGSYADFSSIPTDRYDAFLYTTSNGGMPNVLLEALSAGLPVIAPDVGGIKELINDGTGFLVSQPAAIGEYVAYLVCIMEDYQVTVPKMKAVNEVLRTRHSWDAFISNLSDVPDYGLRRQKLK